MVVDGVGSITDPGPPANVGIATGGVFRLLVLDVDPGGEDTLTDLEREHGALPTTIEATTPRGGRHIYLLVPDGHRLPTISAGKLGPGLDHRCQGGYAAAPPSTIFGKGYAWRNGVPRRFAFAPAWHHRAEALGQGHDRAGAHGHARASSHRWPDPGCPRH